MRVFVCILLTCCIMNSVYGHHRIWNNNKTNATSRRIDKHENYNDFAISDERCDSVKECADAHVMFDKEGRVLNSDSDTTVASEDRLGAFINTNVCKNGFGELNSDPTTIDNTVSHSTLAKAFSSYNQTKNASDLHEIYANIKNEASSLFANNSIDSEKVFWELISYPLSDAMRSHNRSAFFHIFCGHLPTHNREKLGGMHSKYRTWFLEKHGLVAATHSIKCTQYSCGSPLIYFNSLLNKTASKPRSGFKLGNTKDYIQLMLHVMSITSERFVRNTERLMLHYDANGKIEAHKVSNKVSLGCIYKDADGNAYQYFTEGNAPATLYPLDLVNARGASCSEDPVKFWNAVRKKIIDGRAYGHPDISDYYGFASAVICDAEHDNYQGMCSDIK